MDSQCHNYVNTLRLLHYLAEREKDRPRQETLLTPAEVSFFGLSFLPCLVVFLHSSKSWNLNPESFSLTSHTQQKNRQDNSKSSPQGSKDTFFSFAPSIPFTQQPASPSLSFPFHSYSSTGIFVGKGKNKEKIKKGYIQSQLWPCMLIGK